MGANTRIEWADHTWNPWRGCTRVSEGCRFCYADTLSKRNPALLGIWGDNGTRIVASEEMWRQPLKWNDEAEKLGVRKRVFCASLADVFEDWQGPIYGPNGGHVHRGDKWYHNRTFIENDLAIGKSIVTMRDVRARLFDLIDMTPSLDWLLLTKRPQHIGRFMPPYNFHACVTGDCPHGSTTECDSPSEQQYRDNVWIGVSVENQAAADQRIPILLQAPAAVRFLSCEPLLGRIEFSDVTRRSDAVLQLGKKSLDGIHWVIAGGESGPNARPCHPDWIRSLRDQCTAAGVPFFFKQWGEWFPSAQYDLDTNQPRLTGKAEIYVGPSGQLLQTHSRFEHGCPCDVPHGFVSMVHVGKKAAGRTLDGREWSDFPSPR